MLQNINYEFYWNELDKTYCACQRQNLRFCVRSILRDWQHRHVIDWRTTWFTLSDGSVITDATYDDFVWRICQHCEVNGYDQLPDPAIWPYTLREFLIIVLALQHQTGARSINRQALDRAYLHVFPDSDPITSRAITSLKRYEE